jgi:bacteriocin biosynthesis cyclodehydratase domain-containing protein
VDAQVKGRVNATDVAVGGLSPSDVGRPRGTASAAAITRVAPDTDTRRLRDGAASFVVQAGAHAPAELLAHGLARRRLPHLLIEERDDAILVGPLVVPARTACLHCLDLHRRDRDRAWPALAAQIATAPEGPGAIAISTALIAAGIATAQVLGHIDGMDVETRNGSIEITPPMQIRRRSWEPHPACRCVGRPRTTTLAASL